MIEIKDYLERQIKSLLAKYDQNHSLNIEIFRYQNIVAIIDDIYFIEILNDEIAGVYLFREYLKGCVFKPENTRFYNRDKMFDYTLESVKEYLEQSGSISKLYEV